MGWYVFFIPGPTIYLDLTCNVYGLASLVASLVTRIMTMIMQGLKNFSKAARDLLMGIHKIDNANYPEVTLLIPLLQ
jgi:hypothetical protein